MTRALIALGGMWAVSFAVLAWVWREDRREKARREFDEHAAQALATVAVEPCEAAVDRRPKRLPDPDRCPHLAPGSTAFASRVIAGEPMQVCSECWTTASLASQRINGLMQAGVPEGWSRS